MKSNVFRNNLLYVCKTKCSTCIYRPGNLMHLDSERKDRMEADCIAEQGVIPCHKTLDGTPRANAICRGFFDTQKHNVALMSVAERLGMLKEVEVE